MDRARDLFDQLVRDGWQGIVDRVNAHEAESLILEFKSKAHADTPKVEDADKKTIAKALSALANTEGGVIVIGVKCKRPDDRDKPDTAQEIVSITDVGAFEKSVEDHIRQLTDPPVLGYQLKAIRNEPSPSGVLLIYVPESTGRPHRVLCGNAALDDRYYARGNTQSQVMPHAQLRAMFGGTALPKMELRFRFRCFDQMQAGPGGNGFPMLFDIEIRNAGRGVCRNPALRIEELPGKIQYRSELAADPISGIWFSSTSDAAPWHKRPVFATNGPRALAAVMVRSEPGYLIYPSESTFIIAPERGLRHNPGVLLFPFGTGKVTIPVRAALYCENAPPIAFSHEYVIDNSGAVVGDWLQGVEPA